MIIQNQAECLNCGDKPFSANHHDYKSCKCGQIAVDGGMDYLGRTGKIGFIRELSISFPEAAVKDARAEIEQAIENGRNSLGVLCAVARVLRDHKLLAKETELF